MKVVEIHSNVVEPHAKVVEIRVKVVETNSKVVEKGLKVVEKFIHVQHFQQNPCDVPEIARVSDIRLRAGGSLKGRRNNL